MRRAILAELCLSLVMSRERAAATAGDLVETSRGRFGMLWAVAGTMLSATLRQMSILPMLRAVGWAILLALVFRAVFGTALMVGGRLLPGLAWLGPVLGVSFLLMHPILVGHIMARRLPGREMAAWVAVVGVLLACRKTLREEGTPA